MPGGFSSAARAFNSPTKIDERPDARRIPHIGMDPQSYRLNRSGYRGLDAPKPRPAVSEHTGQGGDRFPGPRRPRDASAGRWCAGSINRASGAISCNNFTWTTRPASPCRVTVAWPAHPILKFGSPCCFMIVDHNAEKFRIMTEEIKRGWRDNKPANSADTCPRSGACGHARRDRCDRRRSGVTPQQETTLITRKDYDHGHPTKPHNRPGAR